MFTLFSLLALGCGLGIKHAIEPDHVIAVSTIASKSDKIWRASLAGAFWGIGHTATLFAVGMALIVTKTEIPEKWAMLLEFVVGVMIVLLGIYSILFLKNNGNHHANHHFQAEHSHPYVKTTLIGIMHGFAGSTAMVLLTMSLIEHAWQETLFILVFGLGTVLGMLITTTVIGLPFVFTANVTKINRSLVGLTGAISVLFGIFYMYNLGINEGLFALWAR